MHGTNMKKVRSCC